METTIFRTDAMLGFRRLQSYMLPCLYALLVKGMKLKLIEHAHLPSVQEYMRCYRCSYTILQQRRLCSLARCCYYSPKIKSQVPFKLFDVQFYAREHVIVGAAQGLFGGILRF